MNHGFTLSLFFLGALLTACTSLAKDGTSLADAEPGTPELKPRAQGKSDGVLVRGIAEYFFYWPIGTDPDRRLVYRRDYNGVLETPVRCLFEPSSVSSNTDVTDQTELEIPVILGVDGTFAVVTRGDGKLDPGEKADGGKFAVIPFAYSEIKNDCTIERTGDKLVVKHDPNAGKAPPPPPDDFSAAGQISIRQERRGAANDANDPELQNFLNDMEH